MASRTLFIGDVHGCYDELMALCELAKLREDDHLYFVGDLINKGPKSLEVVEFVRNRPNTWSVIGNHELFSLKPITFENGAENASWVSRQYASTEEIRNELIRQNHLDWLLSLPTFIEKEEFILIHGGIHPEYGIATPREIATLIRSVKGKPWYEFYSGDKLIVYGHWAAQGLRVTQNTIGLDTGCCFGGHLTAFCLETGEFWQMRANKVYKEPSNWKLSGEV